MKISIFTSMNIKYLSIFSLLLCAVLSFGQSIDFDKEIKRLEGELEAIRLQDSTARMKLEGVKLQRVRQMILSEVIPELTEGEELVMHEAMALVYDEQHEQAKWVAHIITSDVAAGNIGRTNDFRPDPKIATGSTVEEDYFLKELQPDGTYKYDGFGFDRGHLAPSADFRWSAKALSESYFYSNMSPQRPDFNRISWALLEDLLRDYLNRNSDTELYIITAPVLHNDLPAVSRSVNQVTVPEFYYKIALDPIHRRAIAFLMPNRHCEYPTEYYAVSIDSIERLTGIRFFPNLPYVNELKGSVEMGPWLGLKALSDVAPFKPTELPKNHFNTVQAKRYMGSNDAIYVCGTVVSTKLSAKGNVFLNLDKGFPNQIFTISIFADNIPNFSYTPHTFLEGKKVCARGKVANFDGTPSMAIENEKAIKLMEP